MYKTAREWTHLKKTLFGKIMTPGKILSLKGWTKKMIYKQDKENQDWMSSTVFTATKK